MIVLWYVLAGIGVWLLFDAAVDHFGTIKVNGAIAIFMGLCAVAAVVVHNWWGLAIDLAACAWFTYRYLEESV